MTEERKEYGARVRDCRECPAKGIGIKMRKEGGEITRGRRITAGEGKEDGGLCREMREKMETVE
jgi:hypothetical protein